MNDKLTSEFSSRLWDPGPDVLYIRCYGATYKITDQFTMALAHHTKEALKPHINLFCMKQKLKSWREVVKKEINQWSTTKHFLLWKMCVNKLVFYKMWEQVESMDSIYTTVKTAV